MPSQLHMQVPRGCTATGYTIDIVLSQTANRKDGSSTNCMIIVIDIALIIVETSLQACLIICYISGSCGRRHTNDVVDQQSKYRPCRVQKVLFLFPSSANVTAYRTRRLASQCTHTNKTPNRTSRGRNSQADKYHSVADERARRTELCCRQTTVRLSRFVEQS